MSLIPLINALPKAELHLHIEGTLTPERMWSLARRHAVSLPYGSVDEIAAAYEFDSLQSFLDLYYQGADVLRDEDDFYLLMKDYLDDCQKQHIVHAEIMFDPQTHTQRGIGFDVFMPGFLRALNEAQTGWGFSWKLIMCFLRDLSEDDAIATFKQAEPWYEVITAVGLDSAEVGNPPEKFARVFSMAAEKGFRRVAHAGEEGPADYIWQALNTLQIDRIDHGVKAQDDAALLSHLASTQIPLTVCPLSNLKLCVIEDMKTHNILELLEHGLLVTVNADDPSYFGGNLTDNFIALEQALGLTDKQLIRLVKNGFAGSFLSETEKQHYLHQIDQCWLNNQGQF